MRRFLPPPRAGEGGGGGWNWKQALLLAVALAGTVAVLALPPLAQDLDYHLFADQQAWLGIPNFWNVISNLPFLLVSLYGLARRPVVPALRPAYAVFCGFVGLVALGSAVYHWSPTTGSLVWDRLPMAGAFMALFAAVLADAVWPRAARLLWPLVLIGLASVLYWHLGEQAGQGDLRPYALVQFLPLALLPLILLLFGSRELRARWLWLTLAGYALAKAAEHFDALIYTGLGVVSGHSLKHLLAALAILCAMLAFPRSPSGEH